MIDLSIETPIPLSRATRHRLFRAKAKGGKAISFSTIWRWALHGAGPNRVKLETIRIGSTLCTTDEAIERFISQQTAPATVSTPPQASRAHAAAKAELAAAGIA